MSTSEEVNGSEMSQNSKPANSETVRYHHADMARGWLLFAIDSAEKFFKKVREKLRPKKETEEQIKYVANVETIEEWADVVKKLRMALVLIEVKPSTKAIIKAAKSVDELIRSGLPQTIKENYLHRAKVAILLAGRRIQAAMSEINGDAP